MLCRFYSGYTIESVGKLTLKEFMMLHGCIIKISEMENPTPEEDKRKTLSDGSFKNLVKKRKR